MTHSHRIPKALVVWALLFALGAAGAGVVGAAQPAGGDPMRIIPADAMFCVRINKLSAALGQMDQFLTGIFPAGVSMPVRSQMGKFLGGPEPAGVDMAGDIVVFWPLPGGEKPDLKRVGVLIPVSDFQQFLTNPNVVKPDAQGILKLNIEGKPGVAGIRMGNYLLLTRAGGPAGPGRSEEAGPPVPAQPRWPRDSARMSSNGPRVPRRGPMPISRSSPSCTGRRSSRRSRRPRPPSRRCRPRASPCRSSRKR